MTASFLIQRIDWFHWSADNTVAIRCPRCHVFSYADSCVFTELGTLPAGNSLTCGNDRCTLEAAFRLEGFTRPSLKRRREFRCGRTVGDPDFPNTYPPDSLAWWLFHCGQHGRNPDTAIPDGITKSVVATGVADRSPERPAPGPQQRSPGAQPKRRPPRATVDERDTEPGGTDAVGFLDSLGCTRKTDCDCDFCANARTQCAASEHRAAAMTGA